jgi:hypothetical protein
MKTYKILATQQIQDTLVTTVEYNFNGTVLVVDVNHYLITDENDVITNIIKRADFEEARLNTTQILEQIVDNLTINTTVTIS